MNNTAEKETIRLQDLLESDHDRLDDLFDAYRQAIDEDEERAGELLNQFTSELRHHINWEDEKLFPPYEQRVNRLGITRSFRVDHREILRIIETIRQRWSEGYRDHAWNEGRLRSILDRHNEKEENQLYPELNELLSPDEKRELAETFRHQEEEE